MLNRFFQCLLPLTAVGCGAGVEPEGEQSVLADEARPDAAGKMPETSALQREPAVLVNADAWRPEPATQDPLQHQTDEHVPCDEAAMQVEGRAFEIDTTDCNFAVVAQPLLSAVVPGDQLELVVWWQELISRSPTQAHLAVLIEDEILWEEQVPIPSKPDLRSVRVEAPRAFAEGVPVYFHLHNHGYNNYKFGSLTRLARKTE